MPKFVRINKSLIFHKLNRVDPIKGIVTLCNVMNPVSRAIVLEFEDMPPNYCRWCQRIEKRQRLGITDEQRRKLKSIMK